MADDSELDEWTALLLAWTRIAVALTMPDDERPERVFRSAA